MSECEDISVILLNAEPSSSTIVIRDYVNQGTEFSDKIAMLADLAHLTGPRR